MQSIQIKQWACLREDLPAGKKWEWSARARFFLGTEARRCKFRTIVERKHSDPQERKQHSTCQSMRNREDPEWLPELDSSDSECTRRSNSPYDSSFQNRWVWYPNHWTQRVKCSPVSHHNEWSCYYHYGYIAVHKTARRDSFGSLSLGKQSFEHDECWIRQNC